MRLLFLLFALSLALSQSSLSMAGDIDWSKVDDALGKTASVQGEVRRYGLPRNDLQVTVDGVAIKPALALGGWLAFEPAPGGAMVMGDLVLTENEVNPVMTKLLQSGIEVTAVHNHLMRATPATFYMHVRGHGDPVTMAMAIRGSLAESRTPFEAPQRLQLRTRLISIATSSMRSWAQKVRSIAASTSSPCLVGTRSLKTACLCHLPWEQVQL